MDSPNHARGFGGIAPGSPAGRAVQDRRQHLLRRRERHRVVSHRHVARSHRDRRRLRRDGADDPREHRGAWIRLRRREDPAQQSRASRSRRRTRGAETALRRHAVCGGRRPPSPRARRAHACPEFGDRLVCPPVEADRILHDGDRVALGDTTLVAHITPGHTKGCTTWTMKVLDGSKSYDVVFIGSPTIPSEYNIVTNSKYPDAVADYRRTFRVLHTLRCDVMLGSHASFFNMNEKRKLLAEHPDVNPFIDPKEYTAFVEAMEKRFLARIGKPSSTE